MPRNPDHRGATREEFERFQRERPIMLRQFATLLQCWRFCGRKDCRRAKACRGADSLQCSGEFMQALSDEMRATFQEAIRLRGQGVEGRQAWREAERRIAKHKAQLEATPLRGER
ncbi:conserved hypothetical protein [Bosea sp. 62]|uniref:hypothetical protein n=1 Tax=unclassified Bosea (in: a-proteobacteria) TaxID=2653178 RepID=UPI001253A73C|nr:MULTISPECIES: hypothetical protein [unclassified Bosea (in: a-proteobacteria)]CAD5249796.1 conserved hypothetical protein [Bosea sp. 46]CAD5250410.1 conserved hypothetical protein [Bosea sp. 21B]CAD5264398.1 conserved hypothetical protein [Bosea sp. 7B]VVT44192.1 conserved hypothetical protein [Bosea sp. EC-HK365B]VXB11941.1 conserved hypothetical protein [Bosea sp. 29B]